MRTRVYVAGPISKGDLRKNIDQAREAGVRLMKAGYAPLVPHLTCYMGGDTPEVLPAGTRHEDWYETDLPWVAASHALLRLPGESKGADLEVREAVGRNIPVYGDIEDLLISLPCAQPDVVAQKRGDPRFHLLLEQMALLHARKAADYGTDADLFANIRASAEFGVEPWRGAMVRLNDKVTRLKTFAVKGTLANEGVEDTLMDLAAYSLIALILFREAKCG